MSRFEMEKRIFACHVNKNLLIELEDYIKNEIPKQISVPKKTLMKNIQYLLEIKMGKKK